MRRPSVVVLSISLGLLSNGCKSDSEKQQEVQLAAAQMVQDARAEAKAQLLRAPGQFLEATNLGYYDKGIINDYRQLVKLDVLNRSTLAVQNISGTVDWLDKDGRSVGSLPLSLTGSIAAGDTKTFSKEAGTLRNGTMETSATRALVRFTQVTVVE